MLQGTLQDFSLPDLFSLLALTKKTGALTVTSEGAEGRIFFREGLICLALSDAKRVPMAARLVSAGLLDEEQVREIVKEHSGSSLGVTEALVTSGQVEDRVLAGLLREQIIDAVFELVRLEDGSFSFDGGVPGLSRGVGLSVTEVVSEANRRLEEWNGIRQQIPSRSAILAMVPSAGGGREGLALNAEQWGLLALIDGRRAVAEVVELTGRGEFATYRVLGELVASGLIQAVDPASGAQTDLAKLIAAREALRSLETVGRAGGIAPRLSSASELRPGTSQARWVETHTSRAATEEKAPVRLAPRTRVAEAENEATSEATVDGSAETKRDAPADTPAELEPVSAAHEPEVEVPAPAPTDTAPEDHPDIATLAGVDRAQVARELASLGMEDDLPTSTSNLTRDSEVNKGLLLRLIDGVKGA